MYLDGFADYEQCGSVKGNKKRGEKYREKNRFYSATSYTSACGIAMKGRCATTKNTDEASTPGPAGVAMKGTGAKTSTTVTV